MFKSWSVVMLVVTFLISFSSLPDAFASEDDAILESLKAKPAGIEMGDGVYRLTGEVQEKKEKRLVLKTGESVQPQGFYLADDTLIVPLIIGVGDSITLDYHQSDGNNIVNAILLNDSISEEIVLGTIAGEKTDIGVPATRKSVGEVTGEKTESGVSTSRRSNVLIALLVVLAAALTIIFVLRKRRA